MHKSTLIEIKHLIKYISAHEEKGWIGTLEYISDQYKKIISSLIDYNFYIQGLSYAEINESVKGNEMEFQAILLNLNILKDKLELFEADKNETYSETCFENIKETIIEKIDQSNLCIWIIVPWFTDKDIYNALLAAKGRGINIQIIMLDDQSQNALDFKGKIEVIKAPDYVFGEKNIHNKFCVFDFKTVITGSYNWTYQARKNSEDVVIIQNLEHGEKYALQFVKIKSELKSKQNK